MTLRSGAAALLTLLLTGCATFHTSNEEQDHWFATDKAQHFSLSAASGFTTTWTARSLDVPSPVAATAGFTLTLSGGALKELWDATAADGSGWSWRDLAWDLAGTTAGTWAGTAVPTPSQAKRSVR